MASADSRVQFCYVPTGKSVPVTRDANTIYFAVDEKQIYVGSDLISKDYAAEIQAAVDSGVVQSESVKRAWSNISSYSNAAVVVSPLILTRFLCVSYYITIVSFLL